MTSKLTMCDELLTCNNWFNYESFYRWLAGHEAFTRFAEIGVWKGHSISFLANELRDREGVEIYAIDLFEESPGVSGKRHLQVQLPLIREIYEENLRRSDTRHLITDLKSASHEAAANFADGYFDAVFIDASHDYESVRRDIAAWRKKVKPGGIIAGHDYGCRAFPGVKKAADEAFGQPSVWNPGPCWFVKR